MAEMARRQPFGMFHVLVDPDSPFEKILAIITMAPYFVVCALVTLIVRCRELVTVTWMFGHLLNELANFFLKRVFKQPRPLGAPKVGFDEHGMPSAHAQFMGFFLSYAACVLAYRVSVKKTTKLGAMLIVFLLSAMVCYSRIELGFHTLEQVVQFFFVSNVLLMLRNVRGSGACRRWYWNCTRSNMVHSCLQVSFSIFP